MPQPGIGRFDFGEPMFGTACLVGVETVQIREEERPPAGTLYNYPPRKDVTALLAGYPAPTSLGAQMFAQGTICKMVAQCTQQGKSIDQAIDWARTELEGFMRT